MALLAPAAPPAGPAAAPEAALRAVPGLPPPEAGLPALSPVKNRMQYRERPKGETEEAEWFSPEEEGVLVEPQQVRLRSIHSKAQAVIVFANKTPYRVRALWVDFQGNEVVYSVLEPGVTKRYFTYVTHPWVVRELSSGTRMMLSGRPAVVGASQEQAVEVQAPPRLQWSLGTHSCFPEQFRAAARGLLLAHKRLEAYAAGRAPPAPPAAAGRQPAHAGGCSCCGSPAAKRSAPSPPCAAPPGGSPRDGDGEPVAPSPKRVCPVSPRAGLLGRFSAAPSPARGAASAASAAAGRLAPLQLPPPSPGRRPLLAGALASPRAAAAAAAAASSATASISITSEAAHFTATLTVSSPKRALLKSTVNIEITTAAAPASSAAASDPDCVCSAPEGPCGAGWGPTASLSIDALIGGGGGGAGAAMQVDEPAAMAAPPARPHSGGSRRAQRGLIGIFRSILGKPPGRQQQGGMGGRGGGAATAMDFEFEAAISPRGCSPPRGGAGAGATHTIKLALQQSLNEGGAAAGKEVQLRQGQEQEQEGAPAGATHLGHLPAHLLAHIVQLGAPEAYQTLSQPPKGRPDVRPSLLACPPLTEKEAALLEQQEEEEEFDEDEVPMLV